MGACLGKPSQDSAMELELPSPQQMVPKDFRPVTTINNVTVVSDNDADNASDQSAEKNSLRSDLTHTSMSEDEDIGSESDEGLEHISEREDHKAHEIALLHSLLPQSNAPTLMNKKISEILDGKFSPSRQGNGEGDLRRSNSTSTLFVDSTVSQPDMDETIRCVASALLSIIVHGHKQANPNLYLQKFDEFIFPLTDAEVAVDYASKIPSEDTVYEFISKLFRAAALSAECAIVTLVYINRVIMYANLTIQAANWKRVLLGAILMASKVWDDQAVWNVDFCTILPKIVVEDMNELERTLLEMLQFNINVDSSVYAKYYFELRTLAERSNKAFGLAPMNKKTAEKLEAMSNQIKQDYLVLDTLRHAKSLDFFPMPSSPAIIS